MNKDKTLLEFIRSWLDENEGDYEEDTDCLYALSRAINANTALYAPNLIELRKIYDREKGERG